MAGWSHLRQSNCGPSSDLAELRQAKVVGHCLDQVGVLPSATNQAIGAANQRLGRASTSNDKPWE